MPSTIGHNFESRPAVHQYRHDLGPFIWIAIWVFLSNKGGTDSPPAELRAWCDGRQTSVYLEKLNVVAGVSRLLLPLEAWRSTWDLAIELMDEIGEEWMKRLKNSITEEKSNDERLALFLRIVKTHLPPGYQFPDAPAIPGLDYQ